MVKMIQKALILFFGVLLVVALSGCSQKQPDDYEMSFFRTTYSFDQGLYPTDQDLFLEYRIVPGDVLDVMFQIQAQQQEEFRINLYHIIDVKFPDLPELSVTQKIMPTGEIILPYIGEVKVLGKTIQEATGFLEKKYSKILLDPEVFVSVTNMDARIEQIRKDLHTAPRGLSKLVNVRPDGHATFPLVGDFFVANKTIDQVNKLLQKEYNDYLPGMQADLFLHEQTGSRIYMFGEVNEPGPYTMLKPVNMLQAISMAGSFTLDAKLTDVILFRKHERKLIARKLNLENVLDLKEGGSFFFLRPEDIVYVPRTRISSLANLMNQIADIAFFNGWGMGGGTMDFIDDANR